MNYCTVQSIISLIRDIDTLNPEQKILENIPLSAQGIDSLDKMNIFVLLEEKYDLTIPDEDFDTLNTVNDICAYITQKLSQS